MGGGPQAARSSSARSRWSSRSSRRASPWAGKLIVDGVVAAARSGLAADRERVLWLVAVEPALMAAQLAAGRLLALRRELLRAALGNVVNERILEKALELELRHFEDPDVYDKMQNARREASSRPLSLVMQAFAIGQNARHAGRALGAAPRASPRPASSSSSPRRPRLPRRGAALRASPSGCGPGARRRGGGSTTSSGSSRATAT